MTVNGSVFQLSSYQSFSYSAFSVSTFQAARPSAVNAQKPAASGSAASSSVDTVALSPRATAQAGATATSVSGTATLTVGAAPTVASISSTPADDRATALFKALDANQDGSVTEDEFEAGAKALLRRGRERDRTESTRHTEHEHHGGRRLERALERAFDRVDGNGDGALTKDELSAALASSSQPSEPLTPNVGTSTDPATASSGKSVDSPAQPATSTSTFISLTVVSIAIRTYAAVGRVGAGASNALAASTPSSVPTNVDTPVKFGPFREQLDRLPERPSGTQSSPA